MFRRVVVFQTTVRWPNPLMTESSLPVKPLIRLTRLLSTERIYPANGQPAKSSSQRVIPRASIPGQGPIGSRVFIGILAGCGQQQLEVRVYFMPVRMLLICVSAS